MWRGASPDSPPSWKVTKVSISFRFWRGCEHTSSGRPALPVSWRCLQPVPRLPQQVVQNRLDEWRRLLRQSTTQGRAVLQRVIRGRITFTPTESVVCSLDANGAPAVYPFQPGYEFEAPTRFDKLFSGHAIKLPASGPYSGDIPHHTFTEDADYGALLERAYGRGGTKQRGKGWRPQRDSNPRFGLERATSWASGRWGQQGRVRRLRSRPEHVSVAVLGRSRQM